MIACLRIPFFAAAVERQHDRALTTRPLSIVDGKQVLAVSEEALQGGVQPGMSLSQAEAIFPAAQLIVAGESRYRDVFNRLARGLMEFSPVEAINAWQQGPCGLVVCYVALGRLRPHDALRITRQMSALVYRETGSASLIGLAGNKFSAMMAATHASSEDALLIPAGQEAAFLSALSVKLLPLDGEMARQFALLGITTMGSLAALPREAVLNRFGYQGQFLQKLAQGHDGRPCVPYVPQREEAASCELDEPIANCYIAEGILRAIAQELAQRLAAHQQAAQRLRLQVQLENGEARAATVILSQPLFSAAGLAERLALLLKQVDVSCGMLGFAVRLSDLKPVLGRQLDLFVHQHGDHQGRLESTLPQLVRRYGPDIFFWIEQRNPRERFPEDRFWLCRVEAA